MCDDSQNLNETESETFFFQYQTFTILNPICFDIIFFIPIFFDTDFFFDIESKASKKLKSFETKNWEVSKPSPKIPKIWTKLNLNFSDTKYFLYRIWFFFW